MVFDVNFIMNVFKKLDLFFISILVHNNKIHKEKINDFFMTKRAGKTERTYTVHVNGVS